MIAPSKDPRPSAGADRPPDEQDTPAWEFGGFRFDSQDGLQRAGRKLPLPRRLQLVLEALLRKEGDILDKDALVETAWPGGLASDDSIARCIYLLRAALKHPDGLEMLETVYGRGYRLRVPVVRLRSVGTTAGTTTTAAVMAARAQTPAVLESLAMARELVGQRQPSDLDASIAAIRKALSLDPNSALAWASLAGHLAVQAMRGYRPPREVARIAIEAADRAITLAPDLAGAHAVKGWLRGTVLGDGTAGLAELDRAIRLDPDHWLSRFYRAWVLGTLGRFDAALHDIGVGIEVNPLQLGLHMSRGWLLFLHGRCKEALQRFEDSRAAGAIRDSGMQASVLAFVGRVDEAIEVARRAAEQSERNPTILTGLAYVLGVANDPEAGTVLAEIESDREVRAPGLLLAAAYRATGDEERARAALARGCTTGCPWSGFARYDPRLAGLLPFDAPRASSSPRRPGRRAA